MLNTRGRQTPAGIGIFDGDSTIELPIDWAACTETVDTIDSRTLLT